jgi:hypothetical protein
VTSPNGWDVLLARRTRFVFGQPFVIECRIGQTTADDNFGRDLLVAVTASVTMV